MIQKLGDGGIKPHMSKMTLQVKSVTEHCQGRKEEKYSEISLFNS